MGYLLLTTIGVGNYEEVEYELEGRVIRTKFPSVALCQLLPEPPSKILVFLSKEAREKYGEEYFNALSEASGVEPKLIEIPIGGTEMEILEIFRNIVDRLEEEKDELSVVLDITYAYRSLGFIFFTTICYLMSLERYHLEGIYYGAYEAGKGDRKPIIKLDRLVDLIEWYYALRTFWEVGSVESLAQLIRKALSKAYRAGKRLEPLSKLKDRIEKLDYPLENALPLEVGIEATLGSLALEGKDFEEVFKELPELKMIFPHLQKHIFNELSLPELPQVEKTAIPLDERELERELRLIKFYLKHKHFQEAFLLMREWIVNLLLWAIGRENWLEEESRRIAESTLNAWVEIAKDRKEILTSLQLKFVEAWNRIRELRNPLAHCGFKENYIYGISTSKSENIINSLWEIYQRTIDEGKEELIYPRGKGRLLITGFGMAPGLLYTAIVHTKPSGIFVITSKEAIYNLEEALEKAEFKHKESLNYYIMKDPYGGYTEFEEVKKELGSRIFEYGELLFNFTGGTSAMQYIVGYLCERANRLSLRVKKFICIDERSKIEQEKNPYQLGKIIYINTC